MFTSRSLVAKVSVDCCPLPLRPESSGNCARPSVHTVLSPHCPYCPYCPYCSVFTLPTKPLLFILSHCIVLSVHIMPILPTLTLHTITLLLYHTVHTAHTLLSIMSIMLRDAILSKKCSFFEHCSKGLWPPPFYLNICPILQGVFFKRVFEH